MKINKKHLLLLACAIWTIAGYNILHIGVICYKNNVTILHLIISLIIFIVFWFMVFSKLVRKHTVRILRYEEERQYFWHLFDFKSFCIMAFMMTFGICIRTLHLLPNLYIAIFYSGLGTALFLAGLLFGYKFLTVQMGVS